MARTQIKPRPEIYRLAAELMDAGEPFTGWAIKLATDKVMVKCDLQRRDAVAKMHRNQIAAMFGRSHIAREYLERMGNVSDIEIVCKENAIHDKPAYLLGLTVDDMKQQRITALLMMAAIVENPNT